MAYTAASAFGTQAVVALFAHALLPSQEETYYAYDPVAESALLLPFALLVLVAAAFLHALLFTLPALALGAAVARRAGDPAAGWTLVVAAALGAAYAVLGWVRGADYPTALLWTAGTGLLPVCAALTVDRRLLRGVPVSHGRIVGESLLWLLGGLAAAALAVGAGRHTGHLSGYRPPEIGRAATVGTWTEESGTTELRLHGDGTASVTGAPGDGAGPDAVQCSGAATWSYADGGRDGRAAVELAVPGCEGRARDRWLFAGTEEAPELFAVVGDPESGELYVLRRG
ncbi:hypothetical protein NPS70_11560 [Streptomyces sp. C10-9-1]|uniref:hypothetical protein n=1 Tax=Streptomyces sp. C10-9-1 TaxID=1859285 RepID=UPI002113005C|nr:hypothetical protein [Streptomyces sp. C10-9-1]MCQ6553826.1 hypothetical protein [Streptomyces sp. C10-9-1]